MQLQFIIALVVLFLILVILVVRKDSAPLAIFGVVVALILGAVINTDGVEIKIGTNTTLSDDNRTMTSTDSYEPIKSSYSAALSIIFFLLALWMLFAVFSKNKG